MIANPSPQSMPRDAYLEWESHQDIRHEYVQGQVVAMTGGTLPHNDLALNLYTVLRPHIRQRGCRINVADVKVNIAAADTYRYPDLVVSCDPIDQQAIQAIQAPKLIVEVLSAGTERRDRGEKFREYIQIPTLEEYVLIDSGRIGVECYRREEGRMWLYFPYLTGDVLRLDSVDFSCSLEQIYDGVQLIHAEIS